MPHAAPSSGPPIFVHLMVFLIHLVSSAGCGLGCGASLPPVTWLSAESSMASMLVMPAAFALCVPSPLARHLLRITSRPRAARLLEAAASAWRGRQTVQVLPGADLAVAHRRCGDALGAARAGEQPGDARAQLVGADRLVELRVAGRLEASLGLRREHTAGQEDHAAG